MPVIGRLLDRRDERATGIEYGRGAPPIAIEIHTMGRTTVEALFDARPHEVKPGLNIQVDDGVTVTYTDAVVERHARQLAQRAPVRIRIRLAATISDSRAVPTLADWLIARVRPDPEATTLIEGSRVHLDPDPLISRLRSAVDARR